MSNCSEWVVGIDLGDKVSHICTLNTRTGEVKFDRVNMARSAVEKWFSSIEARLVVVEVGGQSRWLSQQLKGMGFRVFVADSRHLPLITESSSKNDRNDAELLARLGASDLGLLRPIYHRGKRAQAHISVIRARDALVRIRTTLVNHVRGVLKSTGIRLPSCSTPAFAKEACKVIPKDLKPALTPLVREIARLSKEIRSYDKKVDKLCETYPETEFLRQVNGVGSITALTFVLTLENPERFRRSRVVGSYLGLRPKQAESGATAKQLGITKEGNSLLRRLLVTSAHYVLGPFGQDCDLRSWGLELARRGGKNAKRRAVVAVARKLAVLLHRLWQDQSAYVPIRKKQGEAA